MMGSVNVANPKLDTTVRVIDEFYGFQVDADANEYDAVNSFFRASFNNKSAADSFTSALFRIADETKTPVLALLDQIRDQDQIQLTATMSYYLNGLRSYTTLLGINQPVVPNFYTARNVRS